MRQPLRSVALWGVLLTFPVALTACGGGGDVPSDAVVKIGPDTIQKTTFDHWFAGYAKRQPTTPGAVAPDPPKFTKCIAQKKKASPKSAKGQPAASDATYRSQCQQAYATLRDQVMQFLISSAWIEGESTDRGIQVSDADVKKEFDKTRAQSFPKGKAYEAFLKQSGNTQEDLLYQIKMQDLSTRLRAKVLAGTDQVSAAQIADYYNKNKSKFARPETRDIRVVLTKTEDQAKKARAALDAGQSWKAVASKFSTDQGSRDKGGLVPGIPKGQQDKVLDDAFFSAQKGQLGGPVKSKFGYFVFEVDKITPGQQQTEKQSEAAIKQQLVSQQQQTKLAAFTKDFQKKWKDRTACQKGYATQVCKNAPQQAPQQQAPTAGAAPSSAAPAGGATTNK